jgi:RNA polymerase sigma-70 factor (ECF subfamily)
MSTPSEVWSLRGAKGGDRAAFDELLRPLYARAYRLAFGILHDADEAEDAVQEAAFKAWRKIGNLREGAPLEPWFLAVVGNQCRTIARGRWWSAVRMAEPPVNGSAVAGDHDSGLDLRAALRRLSHRHRLVLVLRYYLDLPFEEIGVVLGLSDRATRSLARRALARLKLALGEEFL